MSRFTGLSGMKSLEQLTGPNSGKRRRSSSSSPGHSISPGSIENLKRATGSNSGAADRKKSPSSSLLGHSIYPGSVENLKRDAGSNSGAADKKRKMTPQHSVASGSFANLKFTAAEKLVKEQASTKTGIDLANSKLKKPSIMEEKLQNAFNENAQLKVKQKEDEKLWRVVPTSSTKPLLDQITETFQQLNVQVEEKEQIEFVVELKTKEEQLDDHKAEITGSLADTESKLEAKKKYQRMLENKYMELSKNWNEMSQRHNQAIHKRIKYEVGKQEIINLEKEKAYMEIKIAELKEEYQQQLLWVQEEHAVLVSSMQQEYAHKEMILISKHKELKLTQLQAETELREITVSLADTESKQEAKKNPSNIGDLFTEGCLNPDVEAFIFN